MWFCISIHEISLSLQGLIKLGFKVVTDAFYVGNPDSMNYWNYQKVQRRIGILSMHKFHIKTSFVVFAKSQIKPETDFGKRYAQRSNLMFIKVERKVVIIGHHGRVQLEKPKEGQKFYLLNQQFVTHQHRRARMLIVLCVTEAVLMFDKGTRKTWCLGHSRNSSLEKVRRRCKMRKSSPNFSCPGVNEVKCYRVRELTNRQHSC